MYEQFTQGPVLSLFFASGAYLWLGTVAKDYLMLRANVVMYPHAFRVPGPPVFSPDELSHHAPIDRLKETHDIPFFQVNDQEAKYPPLSKGRGQLGPAKIWDQAWNTHNRRPALG